METSIIENGTCANCGDPANSVTARLEKTGWDGWRWNHFDARCSVPQYINVLVDDEDENRWDVSQGWLFQVGDTWMVVTEVTKRDSSGCAKEVESLRATQQQIEAHLRAL